MSRCIREGVVYARHKNGEDGICTACGHMKGEPSEPLNEVTQEVSDATTSSETSTPETQVMENEGGAVTA